MTGEAVSIPITSTTAECMKSTAPEYADWVAWNKPDCWCYRKQCRGDLNGTSFIGKPVTMTDLNLIKIRYGKLDADLELIPNGICGDLNHASFIGKRITLVDLNTFKLYYNTPEGDVPECDFTNYNFWLTP